MSLVALNHLSDILESGKYIVNLHAETLCDLRDKFSRHDRLHYISFRGKLSKLLPAGENIICKHRARLVTVELNHLAVIVTNGDTHAVSIRVGSENDISALTVSDF